MILSASEIKKRMLLDDIIISPFYEERLGPNSYNVTLGRVLKVYTQDQLDFKADNDVRTIEIPEEGLILQPGELYLGTTQEWTSTHNLVPMLEGRSSVGRLGVFIHVTAGFGDIGFRGQWTLEITVIKPIRIYAGLEVGQLYYHSVEGEIDQIYAGRYQGQLGPVASRFFK